MKTVVPLLSLAAVPSLLAPAVLAAQIRISTNGSSGPRADASIGPWSVSASVGARGIDVRVGAPVGSGSRTTRSESKVPSRSRRATVRAAAVLNTAERYLGTPYVYGGTSPKGFDCSGFVQYVFRRHGVELPRTSRQQAVVGRRLPVDVEAMRPGDLLMFASKGGRIDHVAIYVGDDRIIHSTSSGGGVRYDNLRTTRGKWFTKHHVASRRVLEDGRSLVAELTAALRAIAPLDPPDAAPWPEAIPR